MGVGPKPIPIDKLETPLLVEALNFMLKPEVQAAAKETGQGIKHVCMILHCMFCSAFDSMLVCYVEFMHIPTQDIPCTVYHL